MFAAPIAKLRTAHVGAGAKKAISRDLGSKSDGESRFQGRIDGQIISLESPDPPLGASDGMAHRDNRVGNYLAGASIGPRSNFNDSPLFPREGPQLTAALPSPQSTLFPRGIQRKLVVGAANDPLEREADTTAERVMRMTDSTGSFPTTAPKLRRKCASCEEEDAKKLQKAALGNSASEFEPEAPSLVHQVLRSTGQPLDASTRNFMEPRFRHDFGLVRVHTDAQAAESARAVGAHAFTVGNNIVFGAGKFAPTRAAGQQLIAHELAHVIQQTGTSSPSSLQRVVGGTELQGSGGNSATSSGSSQIKDTSVLKAGGEVDEAEGRAYARATIDRMAPYGPVVSEPPGEAVSSASGVGKVFTSAIEPQVQRAGGSGVTPEAGFVGSFQACYDMCSGELSVVGWIWAGGGVVTKGLFGGKGWWGAYVFAEKELYRQKLNFLPMIVCGTCAPGCKPGEGTVDWGGGIAPFPVAIKPGEKSSLKKGGIEIGLLLTPRSSLCDADLEVIALIDITKYLGPLGAAVTAGTDLANRLAKRFNVELECGLGLDVSGSVHLCKSVPGGGRHGVTSDSAKVCGGGYLGCGVGLSHDKSALPGI